MNMLIHMCMNTFVRFLLDVELLGQISVCVCVCVYLQILTFLNVHSGHMGEKGLEGNKSECG